MIADANAVPGGCPDAFFMWSADQIAVNLFEALAAREAAMRDEQAVYGLDALGEVDLHPILASGLAAVGHGVLREHPYPHEWKRNPRHRDTLPERRDRQRCDLVLLPQLGQALCDPLAVAKTLSRHRRDAAGSLFELVAATAEPEPGRQASAGVPPEDAYWLEVKLIAQHCYTHGVPGPNRAYASELRRAASDLGKLNEDDRIARGGLLILLFCEGEGLAQHDLTVLTHICLDRELPIASPTVLSMAVQDRIGNNALTLGLIDLRKWPT